MYVTSALPRHQQEGVGKLPACALQFIGSVLTIWLVWYKTPTGQQMLLLAWEAGVYLQGLCAALTQLGQLNPSLATCFAVLAAWSPSCCCWLALLLLLLLPQAPV